MSSSSNYQREQLFGKHEFGVYHKWLVGWYDKMQHSSKSMFSGRFQTFSISPHAQTDCREIVIISAKTGSKRLFSLLLFKSRMPVGIGVPDIEVMMLPFLINLIVIKRRHLIPNEPVDIATKATSIPTLNSGDIRNGKFGSDRLETCTNAPNCLTYIQYCKRYRSYCCSLEVADEVWG
ncbi:hypothetical protein HG531_013720 [Fusarium graminearum]|nr:hypothetical protein HG531_013720 [Fusarium graminearum]